MMNWLNFMVYGGIIKDPHLGSMIKTHIGVRVWYQPKIPLHMFDNSYDDQPQHNDNNPPPPLPIEHQNNLKHNRENHYDTLSHI